MKKFLIFFLLLLIIAALAVAAGCGDDGGGKAVEGEERKITEEQGEEEGSKKFNVEGEKGEATIELEEEEFTEETLGVPIYPGAEFIPGSGVNSTITSGDKENTFLGAEFVTADPIQKVSEWYTARLGEATEETPEETEWLFQDREGLIYTVNIETTEDGAKITILKIGGDFDIEL